MRKKHINVLIYGLLTLVMAVGLLFGVSYFAQTNAVALTRGGEEIYVGTSATFNVKSGTIGTSGTDAIYNDGILNITGGTINGNIKNNGTFNYSAGAINGTVTLAKGKYITFNGAQPASLTITLENAEAGDTIASFTGFTPDLSKVTVTNMPSETELKLVGGDIIVSNKTILVNVYVDGVRKGSFDLNSSWNMETAAASGILPLTDERSCGYFLDTELTKDAYRYDSIKAIDDDYSVINLYTRTATIDKLDTTVLVNGYAKALSSSISGNVVIPRKYSGKLVETITDSGFISCANLTSIVMPSSIITIQDFAFRGCSGITSILIPSNVSTIGHFMSYVFYGCSGLTSMKVSSENTKYTSRNNAGTEVNCIIYKQGKALSYGCKNSTIPTDGSVTSIGRSAFGACSGLTKISIPNTVTAIGYESFSSCSGLTSVTLPSSVTEIGYAAFNRCTNLKEIYIPTSVKTISCGNGTVKSGPFSDCTNLTIYCGASSKPSGFGEYWNNGRPVYWGVTPSQFSSTTIDVVFYVDGKSNKTIQAKYGMNFSQIKAFAPLSEEECCGYFGTITGSPILDYHGCMNWSVYAYDNSYMSDLGYDTYHKRVLIETMTATIDKLDKTQLENGYIKAASTSISGRVVAPVKYNGATLTLYRGTSGTTGAFAECNNVECVYLPRTITEIPDFCFCTSVADTTLSYVLMSSQVTIIGQSAFQRRCSTKMNEYYMPGQLISIGNYAFAYCTSIKRIYFDWGLQTIGNGAFYGCTGLLSLKLPDSLLTIGDDAFSQCKNITGAIGIPHRVTTIGAYAFLGCAGVTDIRIGDSVTTIKQNAFGACTSLQSVYIPSSVTTIEGKQYSSPFFASRSLKNIYCRASSKPSGWSVQWNYTSDSGSSAVTPTWSAGPRVIIDVDVWQGSISDNNANFRQVMVSDGDVATFGDSSIRIGDNQIDINWTYDEGEFECSWSYDYGAMSWFDGDQVELGQGNMYDNSLWAFKRGAYCFSIDTEILVWDDEKKRVVRKKAKDIKYTDKLLVWNFDKGCLDFAYPLFIQAHKSTEVYTEVKFSDGTVLDIAKDHAVFNVDLNRFCPVVSNFKKNGCPVGTRVMKDNGEIVTIVRKRRVHKPLTYTNIITNYHMNCYINGILSSTALNNCYEIKDMKFIKDDRHLEDLSKLDGISEEWIKGMRLDIIPDRVIERMMRRNLTYTSFKDYINEKLGNAK